jgi:hypothetical protein
LFQEVINLLEDEKKQRSHSLKLREKALDYEWTVVAEKMESFHNKISTLQ